jgi:uncharacterized protein (DUF2267 family)
MDLADPTAIALAIASVLRREGLQHALYGGLLLAAYGEARETRDADVAVARADGGAVAELLERHLRLVCRVAFERQSFGGVRVSRVTLVEGDEFNTLDLVEPVDPEYASRALARSVTSTLRQQEIRVLLPEDFVVFKLLSSRERDVSDAASVLRTVGDALDRALVEGEIAALESRVPSHPTRERWQRALGLAFER